MRARERMTGWTPSEDAFVEKHWLAGRSAREIANLMAEGGEFSRSRQAVTGRLSRLGHDQNRGGSGAPPQRVVISQDDRAGMIRMFNAGSGFDEIGAQFNRTAASVRNRLGAWGIRQPAYRRDKYLDPEFIRLWNAGNTVPRSRAR